MAVSKRGRRPMPEDQRLGETILVRLSGEQLKELKRAAGHEPIASYVRRAALDRAKRAEGKS